LRRVDEYPDQTRRTVRTTSEATNLRLGEPDASTFHPSDNYEIKTIEMHEVPCN
jgi:hypothetical protein